MITMKSWGFEDELVNADYCAKRMLLKEQHRCSIHRHPMKDEVLIVGSGLVYFEAGPNPDAMVGTWMQEPDRIRIKPGIWHRFTGIRDSIILESSTHHHDSDCDRHATGGKIGDDEFRSMLVAYYKHDCGSRILTVGEAKVIAEAIHKEGRTVGMVNGCFDLLHLGHVELMRQAKACCEILFCAVNSDASVVRLKGPSRPFVNEAGRCGMVAAIRYVDYVVMAEETTCLNVVDAIGPNVYVTTAEYGDTGPEAREVAKRGGKVEVIGMLAGGYNTSKIATKVAKR